MSYLKKLVYEKKYYKKIYVLDTSVLLFDHNSLTSFEENDVAIPITVLEELDQFKVGNETKNYETREIIRFLDKLSGNNGLNKWMKLGKGKGEIKVIMDNSSLSNLDAEEIYGSKKMTIKLLMLQYLYKMKKRNIPLFFLLKTSISE